MSRVDMNSHTDQSLRTRPQDTLLCNMELPLRKTFFPLGFGVEVVSNRRAVLVAAEASFGHGKLEHGNSHLKIRIGVKGNNTGQTPPPPVRRAYNHLYSMVADADNQAVLDLRSGANFVWLSESALRDPLYLRHNFLEKVVYLLLGASVVTDLHAACVSKQGKGILLCGGSGAGKSTLSYGCARSGWTYTSDDTCYLLNDADPPRVVGHSHRLRFRPEARKLFPELCDRAITPRMEGKPSIEVPVVDLPIRNTSREVNVRAVVYLHRSTLTQAAVIRLPHGTATTMLSEELYSAGEIRTKHQEMLQRLAGIPTFELNYQDLEAAIIQLDRLVSLL